MRTVVFLLGLMFLDALNKHWKIESHKDGDAMVKFLAFILGFAIALDLFKS